MAFRSLRIALCGTALAVALCAPGTAAAQDVRRCNFLQGTSNLNSITLAGGDRITYMSTPRIACADGVRITADSAIVYSAQNMSYLIGHVDYREGGRTLRADQARYFSQLGRLTADGHLFVRDTVQGSVIENGYLVYLRQIETRPQEEMTVTTGADRIRPTAVLYMKPGTDTTAVADSAAGAPADTAATVSADTAQATPVDTAVAAPAETAVATPADTAQTPYHVEGDRLFLQGDRYFNASGDVVIVHDSMTAYAQVAEYDQLGARLRLDGEAKVEGSAYDLTARTIDLGVPGGKLRTVRAMHHGVLVGEDLRLTAPVIQIFTTAGTMDRLVAVSLPPDSTEAAPAPVPGPPGAPGVSPPTSGIDALTAAQADTTDQARPIATAEDFRLVADSIEVKAPAQVLDRIVASGAARGESSKRDSLNTEALPEVARKDWMEGDTVIATFQKVDPLPGQPQDSAQYQLQRLVAQGQARSLYRLLPSDSAARPGIDPPSVSYIVGTRIEIVMRQGEVDSMNVEGPVKGWQLEPRNRRAPTDTTARPDSAGTPPDTVGAGIGPDTATVSSSERVAAPPAWTRGPAPADGTPRREPAPALPATGRGHRERRRRKRG